MTAGAQTLSDFRDLVHVRVLTEHAFGCEHFDVMCGWCVEQRHAVAILGRKCRIARVRSELAAFERSHRVHPRFGHAVHEARVDPAGYRV